jgi:single-strand DNA-binding protein
MPAESTATPTINPAQLDPVNAVVLAGTIVEPGEAKQIAGGTEVVRWTLKVPRGSERTGSDLIDCIALEPVLQQRALAWAVGTPLTVEGALRRRFFRSAGRTTTRVEVEADQVTLLEVA